MAGVFGIGITGKQRLQNKLNRLDQAVQKKLVKASMSAGLRVIAKAIKSEVPSAWKDGRKAIGWSFKRGKNQSSHAGVTFAKAGVGVGKTKKKRSKAGKPRTNKKGVGMGVGNLHWFVLGTAKRYTGSKRVGAHRKGVVNRRSSTGNTVRYTGKLKPNPIVERGERKSRGAATAAMMANMRDGIKREATKP